MDIYQQFERMKELEAEEQQSVSNPTRCAANGTVENDKSSNTAIVINGIHAMNEVEKQKLETLYKSINEMMAYLGAEGEIDTRNELTVNVMNALYDIDEGVYDENRFKKFMKNLIANRNQAELSL